MIIRTLFTVEEIDTAVRRLAEEITFDYLSSDFPSVPRVSGAPAAPGGPASGRRRERAARRSPGAEAPGTASGRSRKGARAAPEAGPSPFPPAAGTRSGTRVQVAPTLSVERPVFVGLLKGTFIFMADLARAMKIPVDVDFMRTRLQATERLPDGLVEFDYEPQQSLAGRSLVVLEDVAGSGRTLRAVLARLQAHEPRSLRVCALVKRRGYTGPPVDYVGFEVGPGWLVGYGMDDREAFRNLPGLCVIEA